MNYWLMKTEPSTYSWQDFEKEKDQITYWEGIRNYQARNLMRDEMKKGDLVFFYHSVVKPPSIMGIAKVVQEAYPDPYALDKNSAYFDPKSTPEKNRWLMVDIQLVQAIPEPITLEELKANPKLEGMMLLKKGSRLSIQPVSKEHWRAVLAMRKIKVTSQKKKKSTSRSKKS